MATATANIIINGTKISPYYVSVKQYCNRHHSFEIGVATEKSEGTENSTSIGTAIKYIGETIRINIERTGKLKFNGVVTSVRIDRTYGGDNLIVLEGSSPTCLLEDGLAVKTFEEKSVADIANEILSTYSGNVLKPTVQPIYKTPIPYITQYKETNYQFLSRIAATYGEWFYFDGESLVFGKLNNSESIELSLGKDLDAFDYGVQLRPTKFKYQSYNHNKNLKLENSSKTFKPGWLDEYAKKGLDTADRIFPNEPVFPISENVEQGALLKHLVETKKASILSDTTVFNGKGSNAGIYVGARIRVKAINKIKGRTVNEFIGNFRVINVVHQLDANNNYTNSFEAIPLSVTTPPVNENLIRPQSESQVAVVKENNDPEKMGRVRVQFKWQKGNEMTPWIRQSTNYASGDRGVYFVPEIGDEVYIDFEQGHPDRPYMTGAKYHSNAKPEFFDPENNIKSIKTRSGHTILFTDTAEGESITIKDKNGNQILIDTVGNNMNITALETISFTCKNMNFNVSENVNWQIGQDENKNVGQNICANAGNSIELIAANVVDVIGQNKVNLNSGMGNKFSLAANGAAKLAATSLVDFASGGVINRQASNGISEKSGGSIKINAPDVGINGGS